MIISSKNPISNESVENILALHNIKSHHTFLDDQTIWVIKEDISHLSETLKLINHIHIYDIKSSYPLVSNLWKKSTEIIIGEDERIDHEKITLIAGPCSVESEEQMESIANALQVRGIKFMRGGAFKPRTSPYSFQGLGKQGLVVLKEKADKYQLKTVTELLDIRDLDLVSSYCDILQIGARNMYNYPLLKELGKTNKPILLKRNFSSTIKEWLLAAEYILSAGNPNVILCERGIRTFETDTRNTLDVSAIALCKELTHLPIIADPSQASGKSSLVTPLSLAALAAGADGLIVEVHPEPSKALSDGYQSLDYSQLDVLMDKTKKLAIGIEKKLNISN